MQPNIDVLSLEDMKLAVVDALEDIKAFDITVMDVRHMTAVTTLPANARRLPIMYAKSSRKKA